MSIKDVKRCGKNRVIFNTDIKSFHKIRVPAKRTSCQVKILKRKGLPFMLKKFTHRKLFLAGAILICLFFWYTSTHIMGITVFGNHTIETSTILEALKEEGVELGAKTDEISRDVIRNKLMSKLDDLAWIGINSGGSRLYIEVVERLKKENGIEKDATPCNIIASCDGEIESITARNGQTMVKIGSGVRKGDVLISGIVDSSVNGFNFVHARGDVFARTHYYKTGVYPLSYNEETRTGKVKKIYSFSLLNKTIPLFIKDRPDFELYDTETITTEHTSVFENIPSLFVTCTTFYEKKKEIKKRTPEEALRFGKDELISALKSERDTMTLVIEENESHTLNEHGELEVRAELICRENIAVESPIDLPEFNKK